MAELVLAPVAEKVLEKVIEKIIDACLKYFKDQVRWQRGMKKELENLLNILPRIQAVVSAHSHVEKKGEALNKWFWQLRDAIDEADDVLDEIVYRELQKQASKNGKTGKVRSLVKSIKKKVKRALKIDSHLKKLEEALQKLIEISAKVSTFDSLLKGAEKQQQQQQLKLHETRETGALIKNVLVGRTKEVELVSQWLRNPNQTQSTDDLYKNISVLSVVGLGGMGKTTLLQHVYEKNATLFERKMWACVSTNFDAKTVIKKMLESLETRRPDQESLHSLQTTLQSMVASKKFLLVLDDIWEANEEDWKNVFSALRDGNPGSKILISTRMSSVASRFEKMIKNHQRVKLEGLEKKDCLQLFNNHAFSDGKNPGGIFGDIAEKMVEKLSQCPLAVKFIANYLYACMEESFWTNVLNSNILNIDYGEDGLLAILKLSYTHLPDHLQNCFSFCCIFPQDHEFDRDDLVRMWIAVGFIQSPDILGETLENTGRRYFNILVRNSFFDEFHTDDFRVHYKMHDLLHDLARSVSIQECLRVVGDKELSIPETIRHLSIDTSSYEVLKEIEKLKYLRSLFLSSVVDENAISQILKASKSIRLLVIHPPYYDYNVPETIDCLIHLRYLNVHYGVLKLSRCISHLYHLQFVISKRPKNLVMDNISWEELRPNTNCHLIMDQLVIEDLNFVVLMEPQRSISYLRFLTIEKDDNLVSFPSDTEQWFLKHNSTLLQLKFENLKSLQSLPSLSTFSSLTYLKFKKIPLLKSLPDLPSSLKKLRDLESLESLPSSLSAIPSLETLDLSDIPLLKSLPDLPSSLKKLKLNVFKSLESLPSSLSAFPSLETLELRYIPLLKLLPDLPSSLKELKLYHMESLESLPSSLSAIPSLETLELYYIPLLKSLPDLPSSLKKLYLWDFKSLESLPSSLSAIPSLETLELHYIPLLKSLPDLPSSLKKLELDNLESLQCLPSSLSAISSLETLELECIPLLKSLPDLPSSLKELTLHIMKSLKSLSSSFSASTSLETLQLSFIPLKSLPDLPSSLKELKLYHMESLDSLPSSLSAIPSLDTLILLNLQLLESLPDLPSSLKKLELDGWNSPPSSLSAIPSLETDIPLLKSLPDLPSSLESLKLTRLQNLDCLPSCLATHLHELRIRKVPRLLELPDFPTSLEVLDIEECDPQLMKRYPNFRTRW